MSEPSTQGNVTKRGKQPGLGQLGRKGCAGSKKREQRERLPWGEEEGGGGVDEHTLILASSDKPCSSGIKLLSRSPWQGLLHFGTLTA